MAAATLSAARARSRGRLRPSDLLASLVLLSFAVAFLFPVYWIAQMAFKQEVQIYALPPEIIFVPTLDNFRYLLQDSQPYLRNLLNSVVVAGLTTALCVSVGSLAAYSLSRYRFRGSSLFLFWVLTTRILPPVAVALPLFLIMRNLGLVDTYLGVVLAHSTFILPMAVWVLKAFFDDIPVDLEEAARIDGASPLGAFLRVTLPLAAPGLAAASILAFIFSWNDLFFALILTGTSTRTMPPALAAFIGAITLEWGRMAAGALLTIVPVILFTILSQRLLIRGLTGGALK